MPLKFILWLRVIFEYKNIGRLQEKEQQLPIHLYFPTLTLSYNICPQCKEDTFLFDFYVTLTYFDVLAHL